MSSRLILFGEGSLKRALTEFAEHYHSERNHQGRVICFCSQRKISCRLPPTRQSVAGHGLVPYSNIIAAPPDMF
jgi:hypothetical protein